jgi:hypothetical protein
MSEKSSRNGAIHVIAQFDDKAVDLNVNEAVDVTTPPATRSANEGIRACFEFDGPAAPLHPDAAPDDRPRG